MKLLKYTALTFIGVYLLSNFACSFRISDARAVKEFSKAGVQLQISDFSFNNHTLHYTQTGPDTNATLLFIHGSPGGWNDFGAYMKDKEFMDSIMFVKKPERLEVILMIMAMCLTIYSCLEKEWRGQLPENY